MTLLTHVLIPMSDELTGRSNSLYAELLSIVLDVDDDDRDIIRVIIGITNESATPISNIETSIDTIGKGSHYAERSVGSIGPGLTRNFHYVITGELGHWVFNLSHGTENSKETLEIGPIRADLRIGELFEEEVELAGSSLGGGVGGGLIADVFSNALGDFGNVRETIEFKMEFEATPEMSSREAENEDIMEVENKNSKSELKPASPISKSWEEIPSSTPPKLSMSPPKKPPMDAPSASKKDPLLSSELLSKILPTSSGMTSKSEAEARSPPPIQGNRVHDAPPTSTSRVSEPITAHSSTSPSVREAPPTGPPSVPPSSAPPTGPLSVPPSSAPPTGTPSVPPWVDKLHILLRSVYGRPSVPPSSTSPTGPPSVPPSSTSPTGPSSGPPSSAPPTGPSSGPPSSAPPTGPPSVPPSSSPPTGPPSGPPSTSAFKKPVSGPPS